MRNTQGATPEAHALHQALRELPPFPVHDPYAKGARLAVFYVQRPFGPFEAGRYLSHSPDYDEIAIISMRDLEHEKSLDRVYLWGTMPWLLRGLAEGAVLFLRATESLQYFADLARPELEVIEGGDARCRE